MSDRPILFSAPMVRALLDGRKSQTRRVLKPQPHHAANVFQDGGYWYAEAKLGPGSDCIEVNAVEPGYAPGDRLWVRETFSPSAPRPAYRADEGPEGDGWGWTPSIYMPRDYSRLTLTVTDVRVQRVQEISGEDAIAEGIEIPRCGCEVCSHSPTMCPADASEACMAFAALWDSINAKRPGCAWADNPWICAISFSVHRCNIDQMPEAA